MLLNDVVWATRVEVPNDGVKWSVPDKQLGLTRE